MSDAESAGDDLDLPARSWSTSAGLVAVSWLCTVAAAGWLAVLIVTHADPTGSLLAAVATLGLLVTSVWSSRARPRLAVGPEGVAVRGLWHRRRYPWSAVTDVRVVQARRLGRETFLLGVDVRDETALDGERLLVFGRFDLGADPVDVAATVMAARH
ncbi:PH domain-containing protein [Pseudonocardia sp. N23]|uniref:PH domain-containing protein n=1 Tax=Pseudonocardia sp. N23 TaxID=1987376 RepID=UPI000BFCC40B|nr:PH domain-containing protein [Pseudonocardia sp. N23]